ncbi:MAG: flagellar biosynthetic protein FliQ [Eubacteriales bacterium]
MFTTESITTLLTDGVWLVLTVAGPMLVLSMIVGVLIAIFQAVTQVHEQTLGFLFKAAVIIAYMFMFGDWMLVRMVEYTTNIFLMIRG